MKKKLILKQIIRDFHLSSNFDVKPRELQLPLNTNKIITLIGVRRSGKSSILYETINRLTKNVSKDNIVYINFEDEGLDLTTKELDEIIESYRELYPNKDLKRCYFFFDEIQNVNGWERFVRRLYDTISKHIFITGSNSKLLSSEIATSLRGRTLTFEVFPLSFREYLNFLDIEQDLYSSKAVAKIKNAQNAFLQDGAFPEILFLDKQYHIQLLQEYFNVLLYQDLVERYSISNTTALKYFLKRLLASSTKQISINKIYNELKSNGIKIGKNTLYDFLDYAQNIYLSLILHRYDNTLVNKELGEKKVFSIDVGLNNAIEFCFSKNLGKALENVVFLELRREFKDIFYYRDNSSECDFLIQKNGELKAYQVTYEMSSEDTKKREIKGLINACKKFNLKNGTIITYDTLDSIVIDDININIVPFYRWVIEKNF